MHKEAIALAAPKSEMWSVKVAENESGTPPRLLHVSKPWLDGGVNELTVSQFYRRKKRANNLKLDVRCFQLAARSVMMTEGCLLLLCYGPYHLSLFRHTTAGFGKLRANLVNTSRLCYEVWSHRSSHLYWKAYFTSFTYLRNRNSTACVHR